MHGCRILMMVFFQTAASCSDSAYNVWKARLILNLGRGFGNKRLVRVGELRDQFVSAS